MANLTVITLHHIEEKDFFYLEKFLTSLSYYFTWINPYDLEKTFEDPFSRRKILLTFDDGFYSNKLVAEKLLKPLGIKAVFFVTAGFIDSSSQGDNEWRNFIVNHFFPKRQLKVNELREEHRPLTWEDICELKAQGHYIGAHTFTHPNLKETLQLDVLYREIVDSKKYIENKISQGVEMFAYPFGSISHLSKEAVSLATSHYRYCFSNIRGGCHKDSNPAILKRQNISLDKYFIFNFLSAFGAFNFLYIKDGKLLEELI